MAELISGEFVVLRHRTTDQLVVAQLKNNFNSLIGGSSWFQVGRVAGIPVEEATLNMNEWVLVGDASINKTNKMEHALVSQLYSLLGEVTR